MDHTDKKLEREPLSPGTAFDPWDKLFAEDLRPTEFPERAPETTDLGARHAVQ